MPITKRLDSSRITTRLIPVDAIEDHKDNYNMHPDEQIAQLAQSHATFGQYRSILVWERPEGKYIRVVGHGYSAGAKQEGEPLLRCEVLPIDTDPETVKAIMLADNLHAQNSQPDDSLLAALLQEQSDAGFDLASMGSDEETLRQMLESLGDAYIGDGERDESEDDLPEEVETRAKLGDIWQCGDHRIICGDNSNPDILYNLIGKDKVAALVTDPPYGIDIVKNGTAGNFPGTNAPRLKAIPIKGDDRPFNPEHLLSLAPKVILWGANHYAASLPSQSKWLIWDKKDGAFQGSDLGDCELAWTNLGGAARLLHHTWQGMYRKGVGEGSARKHPTQKPVDLMSWCCDQADVSQGEIVLDCYLGSGSTLIACERTGRCCYGVEIEPSYCDVALARYEAETGQTATLLQRTSEVQHA